MLHESTLPAAARRLASRAGHFRCECRFAAVHRAKVLNVAPGHRHHLQSRDVSLRMPLGDPYIATHVLGRLRHPFEMLDFKCKSCRHKQAASRIGMAAEPGSSSRLAIREFHWPTVDKSEVVIEGQ